ncbi:replication protein A 70 kDa DNA-binding subunit-like isoform X2 [Bradysia coprophila]|uniref:replication protein A 70 kDa DNA-binding subunit-like isoform X2 n=1 Tax=Bradysia coprophila TaxID=38358 RepID=UPI00187DC766|nr:replication protein A 70 kDa DNA-binding subunit-like isoform X2 [Bradysia coprophila]XP_037030993.1 replication protein A 70 kDa DNA-binding subunit-like isoform X2 [Bradysia coprophila]XP_037044964.1 replication protein A 70 kDa DNA-binding subunit-like isoform X2 [Bradysia coprophila]XP_037048927.1 replication protein A 70 kDa DNA-binding subunit-like isoform X2 [Bradysia coprophila]
MPPKRKPDNNNQNENKKVKFDPWNNQPITPPETPTSSCSKYDYNVWNKSEETSEKSPIQLSELSVGVSNNRPVTFRVSFKSEKRPTKNGDMFVFHAMDGDQEVQVTVFPQQTETFFDVVEFNKAYRLTNFNVKNESKDFPLFVGCGLYICLLSASKIEKIDDSSVSQLRFNFSKIEEIKLFEKSSRCDFIGIIARNWGSQSVGQNKIKRDLTITDYSKQCILLTLWGTAYNDFESEGTPVLIHNGILNEYNGSKTITIAQNTLFIPSPDIKIAQDMMTWYEQEIKK